MPWTIWPALVVLWGVCWMFYEPRHLDWAAGLFEDENIDGRALDIDAFLADLNCNSLEWGLPHTNTTYPEQQEQQPERAIILRRPTFEGSVPGFSTAEPQDTVGPPTNPSGTPHAIDVASHDTPTNAACEATEEQQVEVAESRTPATRTPSPFIYARPLDTATSAIANDRQIKRSQNSKHSQVERYRCHYPDCSRSQEGSGFSRRDHLNHHLQGPHKQSSMARLRAKPAAASTSRNLVTTGEIAQALSHSKKRKRGDDGETEAHSGNKPAHELADNSAEERRLRLQAEEENQRLHQKLDKYEDRMERYEERLDKMMTLFAEYKEEQKKK